MVSVVKKVNVTNKRDWAGLVWVWSRAAVGLLHAGYQIRVCFTSAINSLFRDRLNRTLWVVALRVTLEEDGEDERRWGQQWGLGSVKGRDAG